MPPAAKEEQQRSGGAGAPAALAGFLLGIGVASVTVLAAKLQKKLKGRRRVVRRGLDCFAFCRLARQRGAACCHVYAPMPRWQQRLLAALPDCAAAAAITARCRRSSLPAGGRAASALPVVTLPWQAAGAHPGQAHDPPDIRAGAGGGSWQGGCGRLGTWRLRKLSFEMPGRLAASDGPIRKTRVCLRCKAGGLHCPRARQPGGRALPNRRPTDAQPTPCRQPPSVAALDGALIPLHPPVQACKAKSLDAVVIATDDERIAEVCRAAGAQVVMTHPDCANGGRGRAGCCGTSGALQAACAAQGLPCWGRLCAVALPPRSCRSSCWPNPSVLCVQARSAARKLCSSCSSSTTSWSTSRGTSR